MDLTFNSKMEAYYQKFFELQERLRRSEEERLKLEMRFNELVQISREEEQAHYKKLRSQYKKFLEEDRKRQERNEKIVRTLERIESRVNMLTNKTERVKMLRRQYQNYLQRISQRPVAKQEYFPSKIPEEVPRHYPNPSFDFEKKSSDMAILKKAHGKTNEEKIEILDKYLQNLKSQKDQTVSEMKPREDRNDFNELKYFDEVSKKLNEGFNSNKANSIAEDIMNSIYARHYKTDLFEDETKKISKFTFPNNNSRYSDNDQTCGFGDAYNNSSNDIHGSKMKNTDMSKNAAEDVRMFDEDKTSYNLSKPDQFLKNQVSSITNELFGPCKTKTGTTETEKQTISNPTTAKVIFGDIIVQESEAKRTENNTSTMYNPDKPTFAKKDQTVNIESQKIELEKSLKRNDSLNQSFRKENESESCIKPEQLNDTNILFNNNISPNIDESKTELYEEHKDKDEENDQHFENRCDTQETDINPQYTNEDQKGTHEPVQYDQKRQLEQFNEYDSQIVYDESGQPLPYENNQVYEENVQPYEHLEQYDSSEQPIEQLYGDSGKAVHQYDENGQAIFLYGEQYNENSQPDEIFEENEEEAPQYTSNAHEVHEENVKSVPQYDDNGQSTQLYKKNEQSPQQYGENDQYIQQYGENSQSIQQCDDNGQLSQQSGENEQMVQQYGENGQPIQQYDENGQLVPQYDINGQSVYDENKQSVEQYDEMGQPVQQYNENGQPIQQHDENGQLFPQYDVNDQSVYDENKQSVEQYDEMGQPVQQYNEIGQPIQQYDENGQMVPQYDVNGQPIYDEHNQSVQMYDKNGQPYDENGQSFQQYDENGQPIQQYDNVESTQQYNENGQAFQQYDENSQHIQQYDENGQAISQYGENGQLLEQYDENSQPICFNQGEELIQYDENGQIIQQYDENGQPIAPTACEESYQNYETNEANQYTADQQQQNMQDGGKGENITSGNIKSSEDENNIQPSKKKNVLDLLDTDSESAKQNTSKVSNDSDFDFSNG